MFTSTEVEDLNFLAQQLIVIDCIGSKTDIEETIQTLDNRYFNRIIYTLNFSKYNFNIERDAVWSISLTFNFSVDVVSDCLEYRCQYNEERPEYAYFESVDQLRQQLPYYIKLYNIDKAALIKNSKDVPELSLILKENLTESEKETIGLFV